MISSSIQDGRAMDKFKAMLSRQGVSGDIVAALCTRNADVYRVLSRASLQTAITAHRDGKAGLGGSERSGPAAAAMFLECFLSASLK